MSDSLKVPHLKKEAKVAITLGTLSIQHLQQLQAFLIEGHTEEELTSIKGHIEARTALFPWETSVVTVTNLLKIIFDNASASGQIEYKDLENTLGSLVTPE